VDKKHGLATAALLVRGTYAYTGQGGERIDDHYLFESSVPSGTFKWSLFVRREAGPPKTNTDCLSAVENLVPFSLSQPAIFKTNELLPIKDLKLLVRDYEVGCLRILLDDSTNISVRT
jgi:hypothetical protein